MLLDSNLLLLLLFLDFQLLLLLLLLLYRAILPWLLLRRDYAQEQRRVQSTTTGRSISAYGTCW